MKQTMIHEQSGQKKVVKIGFSWTMFFFGGFVPLFRGDLKWFIISWVLAIFTASISWWVMPFIYNKKYISDLQTKGWKFE